MADLPETGFASPGCGATASRNFLPLGCAHSARSKKVPSRRPPHCSGLHAGAPPIVSGLSMAIEATVVAARYSEETGQ
ncbi:hypothetical protein [Gluconacetobacter asukensis]|uniref:hypothetical protein n=1 Tax=Gluconacetobacter asukensis TaxID=1017181 RepID=UPI0015FF148E|nr:hypothetical protein [Gluconacetobacter asukensis]